MQNEAEEDAIALGCDARLEIRYLDRMSTEDRCKVVKWLLRQAEKIVSLDEIDEVMFTSDYTNA